MHVTSKFLEALDQNLYVVCVQSSSRIVQHNEVDLCRSIVRLAEREIRHEVQCALGLAVQDACGVFSTIRVLTTCNPQLEFRKSGLRNC